MTEGMDEISGTSLLTKNKNQIQKTNDTIGWVEDLKGAGWKISLYRTENTDETLDRNDRARLSFLINPGGPSRHPAFAQDRDYVTERDGVLDPRHGLFLFEEGTKVISYTISNEKASAFALTINSTTHLKTSKGLLMPSTILLDCKSGRLRLTANHQTPDSATVKT